MNTKKPPETNTTSFVNVNVTPEYNLMVREIAWREKLSVSALVRRTLEAAFPELASIHASNLQKRGLKPRSRFKTGGDNVAGDCPTESAPVQNR